MKTNKNKNKMEERQREFNNIGFTSVAIISTIAFILPIVIKLIAEGKW